MYGTLIIRPLNGNLTRNTDFFSKMDPYVKVILGNQTRETSVAREQGKRPQWRDQLTIKHNTQDDIIKFEVWDEDTGKKDDFVGSGALAIATIQQKGNKVQESIQLSYKGRNAGTILVDITFIPDNMKQQNMMMPNNMQAMPNQMMQPGPQGTFPMMAQNQGMIPQQIPQYQQQNIGTFQQQQQPILTQQNMYQNQGHLPQQIQPGYPQQGQMQMQQGYPQPVQNVQQQGYPQQVQNVQQGQMQMQPQPVQNIQQGQIQQGYPQQVQNVQQGQMQQGYPQNVQQMPVQQNYPQQQPMKKIDNFAPPIEQANTMNRNQLRPGTQINQNQGGMMYPQGNPNQYGGHYYP